MLLSIENMDSCIVVNYYRLGEDIINCRKYYKESELTKLITKPVIENQNSSKDQYVNRER